MKTTLTLVALGLLPAVALAECPPPEAMYKAAEGWLAGDRLPDPGLGSVADGACAYAAYRDRLEDDLGRPVGVKVGFTSKPAQEKFGVTSPAAGALFAPMILEAGAEVSLKGGRSVVYEADLIVTVGDAEKLKAAKTREEAAAALAEVRPFIELPDMALAEGVAPTGPLMTAYGVMPWRGVMGKGVALADLPDPVADLAALTVDLKANGASVSQGKGEMLLGHPLDVVLWLVGQGSYDLPAGALISLGSLSALTPAKPGDALSADYSVGGTAMSVSARLTE